MFDEEMFDENEIRRAKLINMVVLSVLTAILCIAIILIAISVGVYKYHHTFTAEKWFNDKWNRHKITGNMLDRYDIVGMSEADIIKLLGQEDSQKSEFKISGKEYPPESTLVYYLGGSYDDEWLIISIENGVAKEYCLDVT